MSQMLLSDPDRAIILAALRYFQDNRKRAMGQVGEIATNLGQFLPPTISNIDGLCARINGCQEEEDQEPDFEEFSVPIPGDPNYYDPLVEQGGQS